MKINNEFVNIKEESFFVNSIEYLLFSFKEFSLKIGNPIDLHGSMASNFTNFWTMGKKTSSKNFVLVFLQTSEKIYNFIKFLICVTDKFKILEFSKKSTFPLSRNFTYLTLKNSLNMIQVCQNIKRKLRTNSVLFTHSENLATESYLFIENRKNKSNYKVINIFENNRKYFSLLNQFTKIKPLNFDIALINIRLHFFFEFF